MNDIISIIIPTFNRAHCLLRAVKSVINQSIGNWELIIIDDGSSDNTNFLIKPYLEDLRVSYLYQEHKGVSASRNTGVSIAKGDYILFLDSDDFFLLDLLEKLKEVEYEKYDVISWPVIKVKNGKERIVKPRNLGKIYQNMDTLFLAGAICYKKEYFYKAGGYDVNLTFGENYELGLRVSELGCKVKLLKDPYVVIEDANLNRTSNSISNRLLSGIHQYKKHRQKYVRHPYSDSEMTYILGYLFEKKGKSRTALQFYTYAWKVYSLNYKAFFKIISLISYR